MYDTVCYYRALEVRRMKSGYYEEANFNKMFGIYVREQREKMKLNYSQLSRITKIPIFRLKKIETGELKLRPRTLELLKASLGLEDNHLDTIEQVARVQYVNELYSLMDASFEDKNILSGSHGQL